MKQLVSIVAPMYNEHELVNEYCRQAKEMAASLSDKYDFEIILVNDGSRDNTYELMLEEQKIAPDIISTVCLSRNFGLEGAVNAGLKKAVGDAVVVMDADLQDPLSLIPEMIKKWEDGADVVVAARAERPHDSFFKKAGAGLFYKMLNAFSGKLKLEKSAANFRLLSRAAVDEILCLPEVNGVFRVVVPFVGMKSDVVYYDRDVRYAGKTNYNLKSMIPYALDSITGISVQPLRKLFWFVPMCFILAFASIVGVCLTSDYLKLFFAISILICVMFGLVFVVLSVISEYISQIMTEVKGRPASIVYKYIPSKTAEAKIQED